MPQPQAPFALIQRKGKFHITARFHLFELPLYIVLLIYSIRIYGIEGAAMVASRAFGALLTVEIGSESKTRCR